MCEVNSVTEGEVNLSIEPRCRRGLLGLTRCRGAAVAAIINRLLGRYRSTISMVLGTCTRVRGNMSGGGILAGVLSRDLKVTSRGLGSTWAMGPRRLRFLKL